MKKEGHEVVAISPTDKYVKHLRSEGIRHVEWAVKGSGINPFYELKALLRLYRLLRAEKADVVLAYTPKANIYGAFASRLAGAKIINNVSGLGRVFIKPGMLTLLVKYLYKYAFSRSTKVFFQNEEDMSFFLKKRIVSKKNIERLPGSGVDVRRFAPSVESMTCKGLTDNKGFVFLLVARLLWDKGVGEFAEAAKKVKHSFPSAEFHLLGFLDVDNPSAIPPSQVEDWEREGVLEYLGKTDDVVPYLQNANCVVLPSYYREGVPRTLLEAAAMGKPIVTTDAVGCRDTVDDGITGFLCRPRDAADLAEKMMTMLHLPKKKCFEMGQQGRKKMVREFDEKIVIDSYLSAIADMNNTGKIHHHSKADPFETSYHKAGKQ